MKHLIRIAVIAAVSLAALVILVFTIAWFALPRGWIDAEARRQASQVKGASVHWSRMTPAFKGLSIGVRLEGLAVRIPEVGNPTTDIRANEVFVRMKLLPLLFRRVEVSSAMLDGAWVSMYQQPPSRQPEGAPGSPPAAAFLISLPRVDFNNLNIRTLDPLGSGTELKRLSGHVSLAGSVDAPSALRISAKAESLYWKPSAAAAAVPLPSPLTLDADMDSGGRAGSLRVTRGSMDLGPLKSDIQGSVQFPRKGTGDARTAIDFKLTGKPQRIDSSERSFQGIAATMPAKWDGTAAWSIHAGGRLPDVVTEGVLNLSGISIRAQENSFLLNQIRTVWNTQADQTFTLSGSGAGSGVEIAFQAKGLLAPGGATAGGLTVRAPAARLNGLVPNAPKWNSGNVEAKMSFELKPPSKPIIRWTVQGSGMDGTIQGLAHPVQNLQFAVDGTDMGADIRSFQVHVASTTLNLSGTLVRGTPLATGTFRISMDRLIAEEWASPAGAKAPGGAAAAQPPAALPVPIGAFTGQVDIGEAHSGTMRITNVSTPVRYDGVNLVAAPIRGSIGTGTFAGSLSISSPFQKPSYTFHLDVKRAPVEQVASGSMPFSSGVTGFLSGAIDLSGQGFPSARPDDSLRGLLQGSLEDGRLKVSPTIIAIARSLGIAQASDVPVGQETHTIRIQGNRMIIDKASGDLGDDKAEVNGSIGLDHMIDLNVLLRLAPGRVKGSSVLAQFAQYARDADGRLPVTLKIEGLDRAPKIQVITQKLIEIAGSKLGRNVGRDIMNQLAKGLARKPDSASKPDSTMAADSVKSLQGRHLAPTDSTKQDPLKKAGDALRQIFGK